MITVPDGTAEQVRQFYGTVLGLAEITVPESLQGRGLIWFAVGDRQLHVGVEAKVDRNTNAHLAYEVDDIAKTRARLLVGGLKLIDQPKITGYDRFHTFDPFGNRLEIMGRV